jgi:hypothetical protein
VVRRLVGITSASNPELAETLGRLFPAGSSRHEVFEASLDMYLELWHLHEKGRDRSLPAEMILANDGGCLLAGILSLSWEGWNER